MWRWKEGLEYWLKKTQKTADLTFKGKEKLREKVWARSLNKSVLDCSLDIRSRTANLDDILSVPSDIKNGLGPVATVMDQPDRKGPECSEAETLIHEADLIEGNQVHPMELPSEENVEVRQALLNIIPYCRQYLINIGPAPVHIPASVQLRLPRTGGNGTLIPRNPTIVSMMSQAFDLPIRQTSVDIELLPDSEKKAYLQESEHKKGFPADECELVAVFRHVPIEIISKLHYINDDKSIVYSISSGLNRSRTRVYDMMVIRDGSKEIHLIPHGTRNRMVVLN